MTIRPIVRFPDLRLRSLAEPISVFDEDLHRLAGDLADTMRAAPGIGITAPHIGILKRLVVIELSPSAGLRSYVNPTILWASDEKIRHIEGSVSMPGVTEDIERHARVRIGYRTLDGDESVEEAEGLLSVCHHHEIDQLNGMFWIERLSRLKRERLVKRYQKQQRGF